MSTINLKTHFSKKDPIIKLKAALIDIFLMMAQMTTGYAKGVTRQTNRK